MAQTITSKGTALVQLPALHKAKPVLAKVHDYIRLGFVPNVLDFGAGRPESQALSANWLESLGACYEAFDPYWASEFHNRRVMLRRYDVVLCSNVLNVINSGDAMAAAVRLCVSALEPGGTAFFRVYEGDGTGNGRETAKGYQRNQKTAFYVSVIQSAIPSIMAHSCNVSRSGRVIRVDYVPEFMRGCQNDSV